MFTRSLRKNLGAAAPLAALLLAWFCVSLPATVPLHVATWAVNARHFSHQERLLLEVASLIGEHRVDHSLPAAIHAQSGHQRSVPPFASLETALKKIDLSLERSCSVDTPRLFSLGHFAPPRATALGTGRGQPPHEPPRWEFTV